MNVYDYTDYRLFLADYYRVNKKRNPAFSYRYIEGKTGIDASYLAKVFQGKAHLSERRLPCVIRFCGFNQDERAFFENMVKFNKADNSNDAKLYFERMLSLKKVNVEELESYQYEFYKKWYYSAVRALIGIYPLKGKYREIAERLSPRITVKQAKEAVRLLEKLDLIKRNKEGYFELTNNDISTGKNWDRIAVREFQKETIRLAGESLDRHPKDIRDISTVTMALSFSDVERIKKLAARFREDVVKTVNASSNPDTVYQLNVQLVPLTLPGENS